MARDNMERSGNYRSSIVIPDSLSDEDGLLQRAAKVHLMHDALFSHLSEANDKMINQGVTAAEPLYRATAKKFANGAVRSQIDLESMRLNQELSLISGTSMRRALEEEKQELEPLKTAQSICLANLGMAELKAGKIGQGTIDLMQAAQLEPLMLQDPDFQRHFSEIENIRSTPSVKSTEGDAPTPSKSPRNELIDSPKHQNIYRSSQDSAERAKKDLQESLSNLISTASGITTTAILSFLTKGSGSVVAQRLSQIAALDGSIGKVATLAHSVLSSKPAIMAINSLASKPGMLASGIAASVLSRYTVENLTFDNKELTLLSPDNVIPAITNYLGMGAMLGEGQKYLKPKEIPRAEITCSHPK